MNDLELLGEYVQKGSEAAFAELVRRHIDWVQGAALRQVGRVGEAADGRGCDAGGVYCAGAAGGEAVSAGSAAWAVAIQGGAVCQYRDASGGEAAEAA